MNPDTITWEARYTDGTVVREGTPYGEIDRAKLDVFALTHEGIDLLAVTVAEALRDRFFYRRRTKFIQGDNDKTVHFLIGYFPEGPIYALDSDTGLTHVGEVDEAHEIIDFSMPTPHPHEGEVDAPS